MFQIVFTAVNISKLQIYKRFVTDGGIVTYPKQDHCFLNTMEITHIQEISFKELSTEKLDYVIAACGYQPRCYYLAEKIKPGNAEKFMVTIDEPGYDQNRCKHKEVFLQAGYKTFNSSMKDSGTIEKLMTSLCNNPKEQLNILIDYSCMPKNWYSVIIDNITRNNFSSAKINLYLSYTPKLFEKRTKPRPVDYFGPILSLKDKLKEKKPVTMIASLDNDSHMITNAIKQVKPQKLMVFIPDCVHDPEYTESVLNSNKALLQQLTDKQIMHYKTNQPEQINALLTSSCLDFRVNTEVMIVPQGPKIFSMVALLVSIRYPDIKLWEIIPKSSSLNSEFGLPAAIPTIIKASFLDDDSTDEVEE